MTSNYDSQTLDFYEHILNNINAVIYINSPLRMNWANEHCKRLSGYSYEEINEIGLAKYRENHYHPDDSKIFEETRRHFKNSNIGHATFIYRQKNRKGNWLHLLGVGRICKRDRHNIPTEILCCGIDVANKYEKLNELKHILKENAYLKQKIKLKTLTKREIEVLKLISSGMSSKEIALSLNISKFTIETHRKNIHRKLGIHTLAELVALAVNCDL